MLKILWLWWFAFYSIQNQLYLKAFKLTGFAQGTTYSITYYATDSIVTPQHVEDILSAVDSSMSLYKPYSQINRFNASDSGLKIDTFFQKVVKTSLKVFNATNGAFDITVYPFVDAWGFGPAKNKSTPDSALIRSLHFCVGSDKIKLTGNYLHKENRCVHIDVNGIAQGYTVDLLAELLERNSIDNYMIELGGEIRIKGRKQPDNNVMTIGIEAPPKNEFDPHPLQRIIKVQEGAITTSGNYRKYYQSGSKKISHLIDPRTGYPVDNELISVTVFAKDAITADAYDNAFMVMGLQKSLAFLRQQKHMEAYFIYTNPNGTIADTATTGFYKMMVDKVD